MSYKKNNHRKGITYGPSQKNLIVGLEAFRLKVEKEFFCVFNITCSKGLNECNNFILDLKFNFEMSEGLHFLINRKIGELDFSKNKESNILFLNVLSEIATKNNIEIDIQELNLIFNDSTIVIHKIFKQSIFIELHNLVSEIFQNQLLLSRYLEKIPNEIHVPVFEEHTIDSDFDLLNLRMKTIKRQDYFAFWGLYFDNCIEADIYDFENKQIISGELTMIN